MLKDHAHCRASTDRHSHPGIEMDNQLTPLLVQNTFQFLPLGSLLHFHLSQVHHPHRAIQTHNMQFHPTSLPVTSIHLDLLGMMRTSDSACTIEGGCGSPFWQIHHHTELDGSTQHDQYFQFQIQLCR